MLRTEGVFVLRVTPGSAAEAAGLRGARIGDDGSFVPGDVIIAIDGKPVIQFWIFDVKLKWRASMNNNIAPS